MPTKVYSGAGTHDVTLTVTDESANQTSVTKRITANDTGLFAHFRTRKDDANPLKMWFNGDYSHDAGGSQVSLLEWNFGDGNTAVEGSVPGGGNYNWLINDNASRLVDWTQAGVPGGIKTRNTEHVVAGLYGDDSHNDAATIQAAINSCPAGEVVKINSDGVFRLDSPLSLTTSITLRGNGAGTILKGYSTGSSSCIQMGAGSAYSFSVEGATINSGYTKGSTSIVVASATGFTNGHLMLIDQLNDGTFVTNVGASGTCTWAGRASGARALRQLVKITSINGTTINFSPALFWTYSAGLSPQASVLSSAPPTLAADGGGIGVENLIVQDAAGNSGGVRYAITAKVITNSWWKNVGSTNSYSGHIITGHILQCTFSRCYLAGAYVMTPSRAYGFELSDGTCSCLVEDSIVDRISAPLMAEAGSSGNVFGYCFGQPGHLDASPTYTLPVLQPSHATHPMFNLYEGCQGGNWTQDNSWGSSSHNMSFRNYLPVLFGSLSDFIIALDIWKSQTYTSVIGNVLGVAGQGFVYAANYPNSYGDIYLIYRLGYNTSGSSTTGGSTDPQTTLLRHGNYDYANNAVVWDGGITSHDIPHSLYLSNKPAWWGATAWPCVGPDVSGLVQNNPAQTRFNAYSSSGHMADLFA